MIRPMPKFIKLYGTLKPRGYRYYCGSRKTYSIEFGEYSGDTIWIFPRGNHVEITDFYSKSGWLIKYILEHRELSELDNYLMDVKTGKITKCTEEDSIADINRLHASDGSYGKFWDLHKRLFIKPEMVTEIRYLCDNGFIRFEDKDFTDKQ